MRSPEEPFSTHWLHGCELSEYISDFKATCSVLQDFCLSELRKPVTRIHIFRHHMLSDPLFKGEMICPFFLCFPSDLCFLPVQHYGYSSLLLPTLLPFPVSTKSCVFSDSAAFFTWCFPVRLYQNIKQRSISAGITKCVCSWVATSHMGCDPILCCTLKRVYVVFSCLELLSFPLLIN